jgi:benzoylformate decarboxylase
MGGLGFGLPGAIGVRMALPGRPVVAVLGDGSALYQIQGLWSAAHYGAGVVFVVLRNGGYAIMDHLAAHRGGAGPWPAFDADFVGLAGSLGCPARRVETHADLLATLDEALAGLVERDEPLLLEVAVAPDPEFAP